MYLKSKRLCTSHFWLKMCKLDSGPNSIKQEHHKSAVKRCPVGALSSLTAAGAVKCCARQRRDRGALGQGRSGTLAGGLCHILTPIPGLKALQAATRFCTI